jgi:hypothetical protein
LLFGEAARVFEVECLLRLTYVFCVFRRRHVVEGALEHPSTAKQTKANAVLFMSCS